MASVKTFNSLCLRERPPLFQLSTHVQMLVFIRICVCVHRKMERREEDEEMKEEKGEGRDGDDDDDDDTEGDDDEETAERSDENTTEGMKAEREDEGSDGEKEENDEDGANDSVKKKVSVGGSSCPGQKCVPGILYLGHIPPRLRPKHLRNMLSAYGEVGRIFLQPEGREACPLSCPPPALPLTSLLCCFV